MESRHSAHDEPMDVTIRTGLRVGWHKTHMTQNHTSAFLLTASVKSSATGPDGFTSGKMNPHTPLPEPSFRFVTRGPVCKGDN